MPERRNDADALLDLAVDIAHEAGAVLRSYFGRDDLEVDTKTTATDPVSAADRATERLISERLQSARPSDGLMGEERAGDRPGSSGLRWVVDPLDGTVNFLYGIPLWSVSIAVEDDAGPLAGVVYDPTRDETFAAQRGQGAWLDGAPLHIAPTDRIGDALIATGYAYDAAVRLDQERMFTDVIAEIRDVRRFGSAALDLSWLAAGRWDGWVEFTVRRWDWCAGSLIVAEAGGALARWELELGGAPQDGMTAGGRLVHNYLADWLRRHGAREVSFALPDQAVRAG